MGGLIGELGWLGFIIVCVIQWFINAAAMWVAVNKLMEVEGGAEFSKCMLASVIVTAWGVILSVVLVLIRIPMGGMIYLIAWLWVSKIVIEGILEIVEGAWMILIAFLISIYLIGGMVSFIM